jgi:hypothetical protein
VVSTLLGMDGAGLSGKKVRCVLRVCHCVCMCHTCNVCRCVLTVDHLPWCIGERGWVFQGTLLRILLVEAVAIKLGYMEWVFEGRKKREPHDDSVSTFHIVAPNRVQDQVRPTC